MKNNPLKIIVTGSLAFDFIMNFPGRFSDHILPEKIHEINLSFMVNDMTRKQGGTAGNIAYNLALLGIKPYVLALAGYDFLDYKKELARVGVDVSLIETIDTEPTASAYIFTDKVDNQISGFYPGAMGYSNELSMASVIAKEGNESSFVVVSPNDPKAMIKFVKECLKLKVNYMFDPGMQLPRLTNEDLKKGIDGAKIVIGNDYEMSLITQRIKSPTNESQIWITTLGEKGSIIKFEGKKYEIPPAVPEEVLDPTGAGDAWRSGFMAGFISGQSLEVCGRMGSITSVYTVEKYGTQTHTFTKEEFKKRYKKNFKEELNI